MTNLKEFQLEEFSRNIYTSIATDRSLGSPHLINPILEKWAMNKQHIYEAFGNKLFIKKTVSREITVDDLRNDSNLERIYDDFIRQFLHAVDEEFKALQGWRNKELVLELIEPSNFVSNRVVDEISFWCEGLEKQITVKRDAKLSKSFKHFISNQEVLRRIQDLYSNIYQKDFKAHDLDLYLSIHPYDYLTMSDNNRGWGSCHSLDGDYPGGNLNYMSDNTTIVAYTLEKSEYAFDHILGEVGDLKWNSKMWRSLVHYGINAQGEKTALFGRQYPYDSISNRKSTVEFVANWLFAKETKDLVLDDLESYIAEANMEYDYMGELFDYSHGYVGYCDLEYEHSLVQILTEMLIKEITTTGIVIGEPFNCLRCGHNYAVREEGSVYECMDCMDGSTCHNCGDTVHEDEELFIYDEIYCSSCARELFIQCSACHDYVDLNEACFNEFLEIHECQSCQMERRTIAQPILFFIEDDVMNGKISYDELSDSPYVSIYNYISKIKNAAAGDPYRYNTRTFTLSKNQNRASYLSDHHITDIETQMANMNEEDFYRFNSVYVTSFSGVDLMKLDRLREVLLSFSTDWDGQFQVIDKANLF